MAPACQRHAQARGMAVLRHRVRSAALRRHEAVETGIPDGVLERGASAQQEGTVGRYGASRTCEVRPAGRGRAARPAGSWKPGAVSQYLDSATGGVRHAGEVKSG